MNGRRPFVKVGHEWRIGAYTITATRNDRRCHHDDHGLHHDHDREGEEVKRGLAFLCAAAMIWTASLWRDHANVPIVLKAVTTHDIAGYNPGRWTNTTFVLVVGSDERAGLDGRVVTPSTSSGSTPRRARPDRPRYPARHVGGHPRPRPGPGQRGVPLRGRTRQAQTVRNLTGDLPIKYVLQTTFAGFISLVDALGAASPSMRRT